MAYTKYKYDVFISYAHIDDDSPTDTPGWVASFVKRFQVALKSYLGGDFALLFDPRLSGGNALKKDIIAAAENSAVLIGIGSPAYAQRPWLTDELNAFCGTGNIGERLFLVEYLPPGRAYPSPMDERIGQRFWQKKEFDDTAIPLSVRNERYNRYLLDTAFKVAKQLRLLPGNTPPKPDAPVNKVSKRLLIAQATDDVADRVDQLRRYLEQFPELVTLLPEDYYPQGSDEFKAAFDADVARADIVVQILGGTAGRSTRGLEEGYTRYQRETARVAGKTFMQWRSPEVDPAKVVDESYKSILTAPEVVLCGLEQFKTLVLEKLRETDVPNPPVQNAVFVSTDRNNIPTARSVEKEFKRAQYSVQMPKFSDSTAENRRHLKKMFIESRIIFFVNGAPDDAWFSTQMNMLEAVREERAQNPESIAFCTIPPGQRPSSDILREHLEEIDCCDEFDLAKIRQFIRTLGGKSGNGSSTATP